MNGDATKCLEAGCTHYAAKPIDRVELIRICEKAARGEFDSTVDQTQTTRSAA
jgi:CheY-like chemotaxis protein